MIEAALAGWIVATMFCIIGLLQHRELRRTYVANDKLRQLALEANDGWKETIETAWEVEDENRKLRLRLAEKETSNDS